VKTAKLFELPIVHSTVNVSSGRNQGTVPELAELPEDSPPIDRTSINWRTPISLRPSTPPVGASAGTSAEAHRAGLERVTQAGGKATSWVSLACELQRDWARAETVPGFVQILFTDGLSKERSEATAAAAAR
jgi:hypothetical protein